MDKAIRQRTEAYTEGIDAYYNQVDRDFCPYHPANYPAQHDDWMDGWFTAEMEWQTAERNRMEQES
jgi:ribosome modulation factor